MGGQWAIALEDLVIRENGQRFSVAAGLHPRRETSLMPRLGFPGPRLGMAAGAPTLASVPTILYWIQVPSTNPPHRAQN
jgi:hypothetical protein